jgi:hypothetical protein
LQEYEAYVAAVPYDAASTTIVCPQPISNLPFGFCGWRVFGLLKRPNFDPADNAKSAANYTSHSENYVWSRV